jgi:thymidine phosphorylase
VGDHLQQGDLLATIHADDAEKLGQAQRQILEALTWSEEPVDPLPHFYGVVRPGTVGS